MRVFISIEFSKDIKKYLENIQNKVKAQTIKGNFHPKENFHMTLKFIGEIDEKDIIKIKNCMDEVSSNREKFTLSLNELGRFKRKNKNIIWIGISKDMKLELLHSDLENKLEKIGITKEERKFEAHITLGRNIILKGDFKDLYNQIKIKNHKIKVNAISLMESKRIKGELRYVSVYKKELIQ